MRPLVSVIIPAYNASKTLKKSFKSLFGQTFGDYEVIVVNDGSTDNTRRILAEYSDKITVINQENKGAQAARNKGFEISKGEYVIFWDADTVVKPSMLEEMLKALEKNPDCSYAYSQFKFGFKKMKGQKFKAEKLKENNYIDTTSLLRREDFLGFDEKLKRFQDWDLWLNLLIRKNKRGVYIPKVLYKKLVKGKGISAWLPSFFYKLFPDDKRVRKFESAKKIVKEKWEL